MIVFLATFIALTITAFALALLIHQKMIWGYRGELFILVSGLYFVSIFATAQYLFSSPIQASASGYAAEITYAGDIKTISPAENFSIPIMLKNIGTQSWDSLAQTGPVLLSYHLLSKDGTMLEDENPRTPLPKKVTPGETLTVNLQIHTLPEGEYTIRVDLVAEGVTWFKKRGTQTVDILLNVQ